MHLRIVVVVMILFSSRLMAQSTTTVDFEDKSLAPNSFYNGSDLAGGFTSRGTFFNNNYSTQFGSWFGWSYSNVKNISTPGFGNQYAAYALPNGGGDGGNGNYGVAFNYDAGDARVSLPAGTRPLSMRVTNTTYTALSMLNGDSFTKKFGGTTGNDPDFFLLTIQGRDSSNNIIGTVPFYLADYRFADNALDYIVSQWTTVDLTSLPSTTKSLTFDLTSTDVGMFGINTPTYFAMDNLALAVPEPTTVALMSGMVLVSYAGWRLKRRKPARRR